MRFNISIRNSQQVGRNIQISDPVIFFNLNDIIVEASLDDLDNFIAEVVSQITQLDGVSET